MKYTPSANKRAAAVFAVIGVDIFLNSSLSRRASHCALFSRSDNTNINLMHSQKAFAQQQQPLCAEGDDRDHNSRRLTESARTQKKIARGIAEHRYCTRENRGTRGGTSPQEEGHQKQNYRRRRCPNASKSAAD